MDTRRQLNGHDDHENRELPIQLHRNQMMNVRAYSDPATTPATETDDLSVLMGYLWMLVRHKWTLALALMLGVLTGVAITLWQIPMYRAMTSMEIQNLQEPFGQAMVSTDSSVVTQTQLLLSGTIRERAASKLTSKNASP